MAAFATKNSPLARYGLAVAIGVLAAALHWLISLRIGSRIPFAFFLAAVVWIAMAAGRGPAFLVLAFGCATGMWLLPPIGSFAVDALPDRISLLVYLAVGTLFIIFGRNWVDVFARTAEVERRLRLAQENSGIGLFEIDFVKKKVFASSTIWRIAGRTPGSANRDGHVSLEEWQALMHATGIDQENDILKQKGKAGNYEHEHRIRMPDGKEKWLMSRIHIERNAAGRAVLMRGASMDITERKRLEALLRETQKDLVQQVSDLQRLHELSSRLPDFPDLPGQLQAILRALADFQDADRGIISLYDARSGYLRIEASAGFSEAGLRRMSLVPLGQGAHGIAGVEARRVVVEDTEADSGFEAFRAFAREEGFRAVYSTPLMGLSGEVLGVMSMYFLSPHRSSERENRLSDICARKASMFIERARARAVAEEGEHRFRTVLEASVLPFNILAPVREQSGRIVDFKWQFANSASLRVFCLPANVVLGMSVSRTLPESWGKPDLLDRYAHAIERGKSLEFELHVEEGGMSRWFRGVVSPLQDAVAVWFRDFTEQKRQEQALRDADQRKDIFLATLAHELRNPLAPIRQAALIASGADATDVQRRWSHDVIERQVRRMALLLDDLLDVARISRGMVYLRKEHISLATTIEAAVETARPLIDAKHHDVVVDLPAQPVYFHADALRVSQILSNLLTNAAKYTEAGGKIEVSARQEGEKIVISVSDNGIGIREDALEEMFQMFTQLRMPDEQSGGLGIGLALAKGLAELHGGTIDAVSAGVGKGSRFTVRLPVGVPKMDHAAPSATRPSASQSSHRILVADDNRDAAETLGMLLRLEGHDVRIAYDGADALSEFDAFHPEFALLDIGMPRLNGNEVAQRIRQSPQGEGVVLVAITGWGQENDRKTAMEAGFNYHLTKPVDPQRLRELLAR